MSLYVEIQSKMRDVLPVLWYLDKALGKVHVWEEPDAGQGVRVGLSWMRGCVPSRPLLHAHPQLQRVQEVDGEVVRPLHPVLQRSAIGRVHPQLQASSNPFQVKVAYNTKQFKSWIDVHCFAVSRVSPAASQLHVLSGGLYDTSQFKSGIAGQCSAVGRVHPQLQAISNLSQVGVVH